MVRNAAIAAGNSGRAELVPALEGLADDADPVVAEAAALGAGAAQRASCAAERGDAGGAVHVAAVGQAGVDMGDDRLAAARGADRDRASSTQAGPRNWSLRAGPSRTSRSGVPNRATSARALLPDHAFEAGDGAAAPAAARPARATGGASRGARDAAGDEPASAAPANAAFSMPLPHRRAGNHGLGGAGKPERRARATARRKRRAPIRRRVAR